MPIKITDSGIEHLPYKKVDSQKVVATSPVWHHTDGEMSNHNSNSKPKKDTYA